MIPVCSIGQITNDGFRLNGSALQIDSVCYQLTPEDFGQVGTMWNIDQISLNESFNILVDVSFGCIDENGADGIAFVLQPLSTTQGSNGEGIGFGNISPSLGVEFDTWQNFNLFDPVEDHLAIVRDGDLNHLLGNSLAGPEPIDPNNDNVEDCDTHSIKIVWDAEIQLMSVYFDCQFRLSYQGDVVNEIFDGNPNVFWGFTAATGGSFNLHSVCFEYASFLDALGQELICVGESIEVNLPAGLNYTWEPHPDIADPLSRSQSFSPNTSQQYVVNIGDQCDELFADTLMVEVSEVAIDSILIDSYDCNNDEAVLRIEASGGFPAYSYQIDDQPPVMSNVIQEIAIGNVLVKVFDSLMCQDSLDFAIVDIPRPFFDSIATSNASCFDDGEISLYASGGTGEFVYRLNDQPYSGSSEYLGLSPGTYVPSIRDSAGCQFAGDSIVLERDTIEISSVAISPALCNQDDGVLTITATGGKGMLEYSIDQNMYQSENEFLLAAGEYDVYIRDAVGCISSSPTQLITSACDLYIPNAFSPNQDGINDAWTIYANEMIVEQLERVQIFDRFGNAVFQNENFLPNDLSQGWDGRSRSGRLFNPQVFAYTVVYRLRDGRTQQLAGNITLVN